MATAETIATALGGRKAGRGWMAHCPAYDDRKPRREQVNAAEAEWSPATDEDKAVASEKVEARQP